MKIAQSISSGKASTHVRFGVGVCGWIKHAGYAPQLRTRKWIGEVMEYVCTKLAKRVRWSGIMPAMYLWLQSGTGTDAAGAVLHQQWTTLN